MHYILKYTKMWQLIFILFVSFSMRNWCRKMSVTKFVDQWQPVASLSTLGFNWKNNALISLETTWLSLKNNMVVFYKITYSFGCKISVINGPFFAAVVVLNLQIPRLVHTHLVAGTVIWYGFPFTLAKTKIIYPKMLGQK